MTTTTDLSMTPYQVAEETFVVPWILEAPPVGLFPMNSLVIRGAEPVIVDTGSPANREQWLNNVWNLVDPMDVRWIFLSHDDRDHAGNLLPVLAACPNATLLTNWFSIGRMAEEWMTPLDRCRFLNDGERLDIGDRTLSAIRPPLFDNPTTRGVFDSHTGLYWSVDTFATPIPRPALRGPRRHRPAPAGAGRVGALRRRVQRGSAPGCRSSRAVARMARREEVQCLRRRSALVADPSNRGMPRARDHRAAHRARVRGSS